MPPPQLFPAARPPDHDIELLELLAQGLTIDEIAQVRGVGAGAIEARLQATYEVLGARNDAHAVAMAVRAGWITGELRKN